MAQTLRQASARVHTAVSQAWSEGSPAYYLVRLFSFVLILLAIWHENRHS